MTNPVEAAPRATAYVSQEELDRFLAVKNGLAAAVKRDLERPENVDNTWQPYLVEQCPQGSTGLAQHEGGADYVFSQIDYKRGKTDETRASRMIATISPFKRTELAYWTEAAPAKELDVNSGEGQLIIGDPNTGEVNEYQLHPDVTPHVVLPPGRFYTFRAPRLRFLSPLVVSGFYAPPADFADLEVVVQPGAEQVETPDGILKVPRSFRGL